MSDSLIMKALQAKLASSGLDWVKLESFSLSSRDKTVNLELTLDGEETPVKAEIRYSLAAENMIVIRDIVTSRKWMTEALKLVLLKTGDRFALPGGLKGAIVKMLI